MRIDCGQFSLTAHRQETEYYDFDYSAAHSQEVFWRVRKWEVRMPVFEPDDLNAFERLFLELAETNDGLTKEFVAQLEIRERMFENICRKLQERGFLNKKRELTSQGQKAVAKKDYFQEVINIAKAERRIIFQDVFSGEPIPYCGTETGLQPKLKRTDKAASEEFLPLERPGLDAQNESSQDEPKKRGDTILVPWAEKKQNTIPTKKSILHAIHKAFLEQRQIAQDGDAFQMVEQTQVADAKVRISDPNYEGNYCYIRCIMYVDAEHITNNDVSHIWKVKTPFGYDADILLEKSLKDAMQSAPEFKAKMDEIATALREQLRGKVAFDNWHHVQAFEDYPAITLNASLKKELENVEVNKRGLKEGNPQEVGYRLSVTNAIGELLRVYQNDLSAENRDAINTWLSGLDHGIQGEDQLGEKIRDLAEKYGQFYDRFESSYSTTNHNVTKIRLKNLADDKKSHDYNRKERATYLLLAAEYADYAPWKRAMSEYTEKNRRVLYRDIATLDFIRSKYAAHDGQIDSREVDKQETDLGEKVLDTLIHAFYGGNAR